jgi:N-terminal half of MaoC dehydratase
MADRAAIGKEGVAFEIAIERGKIREFARATRSTHADYFEGERPVVPPMFLTTMFFWEEGVNGANPWHFVKLDQKRGMHAEQEYVFHGPPPRAGDVLVARSRIESVYEKEGRRGGKLTFAVMVTEFRDASGKLVAEARMTGVETEKPPTEETK